MPDVRFGALLNLPAPIGRIRALEASRLDPDKVEDPYTQNLVRLLKQPEVKLDLFEIPDDVMITLHSPLNMDMFYSSKPQNAGLSVKTILHIPSDSIGSYSNHRLEYDYTLSQPDSVTDFALGTVLNVAKGFGNLLLQNRKFFQENPPRPLRLMQTGESPAMVISREAEK